MTQCFQNLTSAIHLLENPLKHTCGVPLHVGGHEVLCRCQDLKLVNIEELQLAVECLEPRQHDVVAVGGPVDAVDSLVGQRACTARKWTATPQLDTPVCCHDGCDLNPILSGSAAPPHTRHIAMHVMLMTRESILCQHGDTPSKGTLRGQSTNVQSQLLK